MGNLVTANDCDWTRMGGGVFSIILSVHSRSFSGCFSREGAEARRWAWEFFSGDFAKTKNAF